MAIADLTESRVQNEILSTTAEAIHPGIRENALDAHPGVSVFFGKIGAALSGQIGADGSPSGSAARAKQGESIKVRVKLDNNGSARRLSSGYSELSVDTSDTIRGTRANWKLYGATAIMSNYEKRNNRGSAQVADLWNHKHNDAMSALVDMVASDLFSTSTPSNSITSIDSIVDAGSSSLQGADATTYSKWASRGLQAKGTLPASVTFSGGSFAASGIANWRRAFLNAEEGSIRPNVILTNDDVYLWYEASLVPQVRFTSDQMKGQLGFSSLSFREAPVFHDPYCPSGYTYFINTDTLMGAYAEGALFDMSPVTEQAFQDAFSVKIIFQGNLICEGRKFNNKVTSQMA
jgi:hypothetical protein